MVALTDSPLSPVATGALHTLCFTAAKQADNAATHSGQGSFFHTTAGLLGLAEHVIARVATLGGPQALQRLSDVEARLAEEHVYWAPTRRTAAGWHVSS
ncbi:hypothetical protein [Bordetella holmesii]|uniref:hypothetical protein n=2 Tax=Bordetella holmesii TaxID=35814 RepID=UPI003C6FCACA